MRLAADLKTYIRETLTTDSNYMTMVAVFADEIHYSFKPIHYEIVE